MVETNPLRQDLLKVTREGRPFPQPRVQRVFYHPPNAQAIKESDHVQGPTGRLQTRVTMFVSSDRGGVYPESTRSAKPHPEDVPLFGPTTDLATDPWIMQVKMGTLLFFKSNGGNPKIKQSSRKAARPGISLHNGAAAYRAPTRGGTSSACAGIPRPTAHRGIPRLTTHRGASVDIPVDFPGRSASAGIPRLTAHRGIPRPTAHRGESVDIPVGFPGRRSSSFLSEDVAQSASTTLLRLPSAKNATIGGATVPVCGVVLRQRVALLPLHFRGDGVGGCLTNLRAEGPITTSSLLEGARGWQAIRQRQDDATVVTSSARDAP